MGGSASIHKDPDADLNDILDERQNENPVEDRSLQEIVESPEAQLTIQKEIGNLISENVQRLASPNRTIAKVNQLGFPSVTLSFIKGELVDVQDPHGVEKWTAGRICQVVPDPVPGYLNIEVTYPYWSAKLNEWIRVRKMDPKDQIECRQRLRSNKRERADSKSGTHRIAPLGMFTFQDLNDDYSKLVIAMRIDVKVKGRWLRAIVKDIDMEQMSFKIHYIGWSSQWDEWIPMNNFVEPTTKTTRKTNLSPSHIAPFGLYTEQEESRMRGPSGRIIEHVHQKKELIETSPSTVIKRQESPTTISSVNTSSGSERLKKLLSPSSDKYRQRPPSLSTQKKRHSYNNLQDFKRQRRKPKLKKTGSYSDDIDSETRMLSSLLLKGLALRKIEADGNCLFRAISYETYGSESHYQLVRNSCCDYMLLYKDFFKYFIDGGLEEGGFERYIQTRREDGVWGDDPEIQAISELYNRPVEIYSCGPEGSAGAMPMRTFHEEIHQENSSTSEVNPELPHPSPKRSLSLKNIVSPQKSSGNLQSTESVPPEIPMSPIRYNFSKTPFRLYFKGGFHYDAVISADENKFAMSLIGHSPGTMEALELSKGVI